MRRGDEIECGRTFRSGAAVGALFGIAMFFMLMGPTPLDPTNIGWLEGGDPLTYYLGGAFFLDSPWAFPPGLNPRYGLDIPNSIYLTDSVPLIAYIFKIIRGLTGTTAQYMGVWLLICFALQGLFGWMFASYFTQSQIVRASVTILLLFMPAFLIRTLELAQYPTSAHFLVIAALVVYLWRPANRGVIWILLGVAAVLSQSYFYAMVVGVWVADIAQRLIWERAGWRTVVLEPVGMFGGAAVALWLSGFFVISSGLSTEGYGVWRSGMFSPFDMHSGVLDWSYFLPALPKLPPEGRNFYGSGIILLLCVALVSWLVRVRTFSLERRLWPLIVAGILMYLFALSNRVAIFRYEFVIDLPQALLRLAGFLRVSDRFVWPLMYVAVGLAASTLCHALNRRIAILLAGVAAMLQVVDTRVAWTGESARITGFRSPVWRTVLVSPFWDKAGKIYKNVRRFPIGNRQEHFDQFAYFALRHGMATNTVYQSRFDVGLAEAMAERFVADLKSGALDPQTLYILDQRYLSDASEHRRPGDLLKQIDGFLVLAPGWQDCAECKALTDGS